MSLEQELGISSNSSAPREDHWIPLADIMTALMMMFMLIALMFMIKVQSDAAKINRIAVVYDEMRENIYIDLEKEFHSDLPRWGATLDRDLTIRFREPDVLFDTGSDVLKPRFTTILQDFFPRYLKILTQKKYRTSIEEVRIEGHTSSKWNDDVSVEDAYFLNMALSQSRTRSALKYVLLLPSVSGDREWLKAHLTANGLSSSKLIRRSDGTEDAESSQRVEFRIRTNADARMAQMLQASAK